jgi:hypothetical protein
VAAPDARAAFFTAAVVLRRPVAAAHRGLRERRHLAARPQHRDLVVAFLLIALLQNTERRGDRALHRKVDAVAAALADFISVQDDDRLRDSVGELRVAVKLKRQI